MYERPHRVPHVSISSLMRVDEDLECNPRELPHR